MPHTDSNIPQNILYSTITEKTLKTARLTLFLGDFIPKTKEPINHMESHGVFSNETCIRKNYFII